MHHIGHFITDIVFYALSFSTPLQVALVGVWKMDSRGWVATESKEGKALPLPVLEWVLSSRGLKTHVDMSPQDTNQKKKTKKPKLLYTLHLSKVIVLVVWDKFEVECVCSTAEPIIKLPKLAVSRVCFILALKISKQINHPTISCVGEHLM